VANEEGVKITEEAINTIAETSRGDMRRGINNLQAASLLNVEGKEITEDDVYDITATVDKDVIDEIITSSLGDSLHISLSEVVNLLNEGASGKEIAIQIFYRAQELDLDDMDCSLISSLVSDAIYNITIGGSEKIQLRGLVAGIYNGKVNI
jgi:replication factor C small subunit